MDLLSMAQTIWRHKFATLPVILITFTGVVYVMKIKPPVYKTSASYILVTPPPPPTTAQINRDPALAQIKTANPYANWDPSYVTSVLTQTLTTDPIHRKLVREGADPRFTVGPSVAYPIGTPIVEVTGIASSAPMALRSALLVGQELGTELDALQAAQGTDPRYFVKVQKLSPPGAVAQQLSSKIRTLIAVLAFGVIMLFVTVSVMTAIEERRARRARATPPAIAESGLHDSVFGGGRWESDGRAGPGDGDGAGQEHDLLAPDDWPTAPAPVSAARPHEEGSVDEATTDGDVTLAGGRRFGARRSSR